MYTREKMLKQRYGITEVQYAFMLYLQDGVCAICHQEEKVKGKYGVNKPLAVDHCHQTGKVRKLLCFRCNTTLGKVEKAYRKYSSYIDAHRGIAE